MSYLDELEHFAYTGATVGNDPIERPANQCGSTHTESLLDTYLPASMWSRTYRCQLDAPHDPPHEHVELPTLLEPEGRRVEWGA